MHCAAVGDNASVEGARADGGAASQGRVGIDKNELGCGWLHVVIGNNVGANLQGTLHCKKKEMLIVP